eukprot:jgi/Hompol1/2373/HPOL_005974-RA
MHIAGMIRRQQSQHIALSLRQLFAARSVSSNAPRSQTQSANGTSSSNAVPASEHIANALNNASATDAPLHSRAHSLLHRIIVAPALHYLSGLSLLYTGSAYTFKLWMNVKETGRATARHDIRHVMSVFYMALPLQRFTLPFVFRHIPALVPSVFFTEDVLFAKVSDAELQHAALAEKIRIQLINFLKAIPAETLANSSVPGAERRRTMLLNMLEHPETAKESDLIELFSFCSTHVSPPRLLQWGDWIIKDDKLIRQDGVKSLSEFELYEALNERGYIPTPGMRVRDLEAMVSKHTAFSAKLLDIAVRYRLRAQAAERIAAGIKQPASPIKLADVELSPQDIGGLTSIMIIARVL